MGDEFRATVDCEGHARMATVVLPNGTRAATTDYGLSAALARAALDLWASRG